MVSSTRCQVALLLLVLAMPAAAMSACAGEDFPPGRSYVTCQDLPVLGAALHWTYDADAPSLSLAFVAAPAAPGGWVGWGINPTGAGMLGAQALVALVAGGASSSSAAAPSVRTYNLTSYTPLGNASTHIAFPATGLAADVDSGGRIRLYATLRLEKATKQVVNHVWQVGSSVTRGAPDMHAVETENLAAMGKLDLAMGTAASPPAAAGGPSRSRDGNGDGSSSQSQLPLISRAADTAGVFALLGFWAMMVG